MENVKDTQENLNESRAEITVDFYTIFRDVLKNLWMVIIIGISAAFLSYIGASLLYHPEYRSQTTFVVSARGSNTGAYANLSQTQKLASVFRTVLDSQILKKRVAETWGMESFDGTVNISIVPETNLLTVSVTSDSPETSFRLLNTMLDVYPEISNNILGEVVMEVFEDPNFPSSPTEYFHGRDVMERAFLIGAGVMICIFAVISYMTDTVKTEKQASAKLDAPLVASVYHERKYRNIRAFLSRKKKKIWISEPSVSFGFEETIKKIRTKIIYQQKKTHGKILVLTSTAPQEGKTTMAVNLAMAFSQNAQKVLLIQGDLRQSGTRKLLSVPKSVPDWGSQLLDDGKVKEAVYESKNLGFSVMVNDQKIQNSSNGLLEL